LEVVVITRKTFALVLFSVLAASSVQLIPVAFANDDPSFKKDDPSLKKADLAFLQAVSSSDKKTLSSILDQDFSWTDSVGKTYTRDEVLQNTPNSPANSISSEIQQRLYGQVGLILATSGKTHAARFWVKRSNGWHLLVYHEATLAEEARSGAPRPKVCENPCKTLPYEPQNDSERGIVASWQALETAVTNHDSQTWAQHVADEFLLINSNNDHPFTKADRIAILDKQKQTGTSSAPIPLVSAQMFDFGDTVIMAAKHQRDIDKPVRVSRIWIKRDGQWLMAFSEQTIVQ
jgi:ketosteroid isomerase-like protein